MEPTTNMTSQGIRDLNRLGPTKKQRRLAREEEIRASAEAPAPEAESVDRPAPEAAPPASGGESPPAV